MAGGSSSRLTRVYPKNLIISYNKSSNSAVDSTKPSCWRQSPST